MVDKTSFTEYHVHAFFRSMRPYYRISRTCVLWSTRPCCSIACMRYFLGRQGLVTEYRVHAFFHIWFSFDICPQYYACLGTPCCQSTRFQSTCVKSSFVLSPVLLPQLLTCVWHSNLLRVSRRVEGCERRTWTKTVVACWCRQLNYIILWAQYCT